MTWGVAIGLVVLAAWGVIACAIFFRRDQRERERLEREAARRREFFGSKSVRWVSYRHED